MGRGALRLREECAPTARASGRRLRAVCQARHSALPASLRRSRFAACSSVSTVCSCSLRTRQRCSLNRAQQLFDLLLPPSLSSTLQSTIVALTQNASLVVFDSHELLLSKVRIRLALRRVSRCGTSATHASHCSPVAEANAAVWRALLGAQPRGGGSRLRLCGAAGALPSQFRAVSMKMFTPGSAGVCKLSQPVRVC